MTIEVLALQSKNEMWVKVYFEPDTRWSIGGGRITVNIGDDYIGSHFFSHVSDQTFKDFIGNCGTDYLVSKVFKSKQWVCVQDGEELIECIAREHLDRVKQARYSGITKEELRELYDDINSREFPDIGNLWNQLDSDSCDTMASIFGQDWYYDHSFKKIDHHYKNQLSAIERIQAHLKNIDV